VDEPSQVAIQRNVAKHASVCPHAPRRNTQVVNGFGICPAMHPRKQTNKATTPVMELARVPFSTLHVGNQAEQGTRHLRTGLAVASRGP
jgi:hypothetical protein